MAKALASILASAHHVPSQLIVIYFSTENSENSLEVIFCLFVQSQRGLLTVFLMDFFQLFESVAECPVGLIRLEPHLLSTELEERPLVGILKKAFHLADDIEINHNGHEIVKITLQLSLVLVIDSIEAVIHLIQTSLQMLQVNLQLKQATLRCLRLARRLGF